MRAVWFNLWLDFDQPDPSEAYWTDRMMAFQGQNSRQIGKNSLGVPTVTLLCMPH